MSGAGTTLLCSDGQTIIFIHHCVLMNTGHVLGAILDIIIATSDEMYLWFDEMNDLGYLISDHNVFFWWWKMDYILLFTDSEATIYCFISTF